MAKVNKSAKSDSKSASPKGGFGARMSKVFSTIKSETFHVGFQKINLWVSCGNYALNRLLSNDYKKAFLFGRSVNIYGESGSGKSLVVANTCGIAQRELGAFIVWVDVEGATDDSAGEQWLRDAGVDVDNNFQYIRCGTINDGQAIVSNMVKDYRKAREAGEEVPPVMIVFDSYSAFLTDNQWEQAVKGENKGDQGQKTKQLGEMVLRCNHLLAGLPILVVGILHVYDSQDPQSGEKHKTTGGNKVLFMASTALLFSKYQLRAEDTENKAVVEDEEDKAIVGMRCQAKILKSRFSKPFEKVWIQVPYDTGIDPYSGLFDLMLEDDLITVAAQGWYQFTRDDGSVVKFQKRSFRQYADELMQRPVAAVRGNGIDLTPTDIKAEIEAEAASVQ